tara:strand:- start:1033 stop:1407 length:375 start_codon:yes stop_codon:yes gene_type:complete
MKNNMILLKKVITLTFLIFWFTNLNAKSSCADMIDMVESESYGTTYYSYDSDAISQVTFHEVTDDSYNTYYFAIVKFKSSYNEYIYQVSSSTKSNYSMNYRQSAGEAFWQYIQPYNDNLNCAPN